MSQKKPLHFSAITPFLTRTGTIISLFILVTMSLIPARPGAAAGTQDCSDVFTPLSTYVTDGVATNKWAYQRAQNETGVPWEMLAAIHYRETNFSHTNPSNGQGIFQFVNAAGGPYPAGVVSDDEFYRQLKFMANKLQTDYVWRGSVPRDRRQLQPGETNMALIKDTLFSYNGRATVYANQASQLGYNSTNQPYEGSPYVMNRFDCGRARMGIITQDFGSMDGIDTRYGAFTVFARLRGDAYWRSLLPFYTEEINMSDAQRRIQTIEFNGQIYTFYYDALQQVLRMATQDPTLGWQFNILDGSTTGGNGRIFANVGGSVTVTKYLNTMQLFYYDKTNGNMRHAWTSDGTAWQFENLDGDPGSTSTRSADVGANPSVVVYGNSMQLFYYDKTNDNLRHAWASTERGWQFENLDGDPGSTAHNDADAGMFTTATTYFDSIQLFYYDKTHHDLRHAWTSSTVGWRFEDFDGSKTGVSKYDYNIGVSPSIAVLGDGLQLYYYDQDHSNLRHAFADTQHGWQFEDLDGDGNTAVSKKLSDAGLTSQVAVNGDLINIFYYDKTNRNLRRAWASSSQGWQFVNMDGDSGSLGGQDGDAGIHVGATMFQGSTQVYYYNRTSGSLRHAWTDVTGWHFEDLGPTVIY